MTLPLTHISIKGLHGTRDLTIPIRDGRIVMVGRNGLGKTTVINIMYLALSQQWDRLQDYSFTSLELAFPGQTIVLSRKPDDTPKNFHKRVKAFLSNSLPASVLSSIGPMELELLSLIAKGELPTDEMYRISQRIGVPLHYFAPIIEGSLGKSSSFDSDAIKKAEEILKSFVGSDQIVYLPTYRRIEKDLKLIVPGLEEQLEGYHRRRLVRRRESPRAFVELVEFGMVDVEQTFRRIRVELTDSARAQLNTLAGSYLRDVIRGQGAEYDPKEFTGLDADEVREILGRVEESTLNENDKERLQQVILKLASQDGGTQLQGDKYIAHFFAKLIEVHRALQSREAAISQFVSVCNGYLSDKEIAFDSKTYSISITLASNQEIKLKDLSSGEKQIVSLFAHIFLQGDDKYLLLIDEPELSLSVPWQKKLLPDIWDSGRVRFLGSVTHSPFIFENSLDEYSVDLAGCISERKGNVAK